jgi:hypothetical protein
LLSAAIPALAQEPTSQPGIIIGGSPPANAGHQPGSIRTSRGGEGPKFERCVDVTIGDEKAFGCMNEKLKGEVDRVNPPILNIPPIDARSPDLKVGVVNVPAVQQQYGKNFGVSAFPYRPPPPVFVSPTGPASHR